MEDRILEGVSQRSPLSHKVNSFLIFPNAYVSFTLLSALYVIDLVKFRQVRCEISYSTSNGLIYSQIRWQLGYVDKNEQALHGLTSFQDQLRGQYQHLSADPHSLANLDQGGLCG